MLSDETGTRGLRVTVMRWLDFMSLRRTRTAQTQEQETWQRSLTEGFWSTSALIQGRLSRKSTMVIYERGPGTGIPRYRLGRPRSQ